jgi:hypothetical protein
LGKEIIFQFGLFIFSPAHICSPTGTSFLSNAKSRSNRLSSTETAFFKNATPAVKHHASPWEITANLNRAHFCYSITAGFVNKNPDHATALDRVEHPVIIDQAPDGLHGQLVQHPGDCQGDESDNDLPSAAGIGTEPDQGQGQGADAQQGDDNDGGLEIPVGVFLLRSGWSVEELATVLAFDCLVLNLFRAEWTLLHNFPIHAGKGRALARSLVDPAFIPF